MDERGGGGGGGGGWMGAFALVDVGREGGCRREEGRARSGTVEYIGDSGFKKHANGICARC